MFFTALPALLRCTNVERKPRITGVRRGPYKTKKRMLAEAAELQQQKEQQQQQKQKPQELQQLIQHQQQMQDVSGTNQFKIPTSLVSPPLVEESSKGVGLFLLSEICNFVSAPTLKDETSSSASASAAFSIQPRGWDSVMYQPAPSKTNSHHSTGESELLDLKPSQYLYFNQKQSSILGESRFLHDTPPKNTQTHSLPPKTIHHYYYKLQQPLYQYGATGGCSSIQSLPSPQSRPVSPADHARRIVPFPLYVTTGSSSSVPFSSADDLHPYSSCRSSTPTYKSVLLDHLHPSASAVTKLHTP